MDGPFGMKMELRRMALKEGYNLDELDPSDGVGDDPKKAFIEDLMSCMGLTPEDLKHVYGDPGDYEYSHHSEDDEDSDDSEEDEELDRSGGGRVDWSKYLDPNFNKKLDDDVPTPPATPPPSVITYRRRGCKRSNDCEIKKKLDDDDDVPTPLATTGAAAAADG